MQFLNPPQFPLVVVISYKCRSSHGEQSWKTGNHGERSSLFIAPPAGLVFERFTMAFDILESCGEQDPAVECTCLVTGFVKNIKGFFQKFMEKVGDFWCAKLSCKRLRSKVFSLGQILTKHGLQCQKHFLVKNMGLRKI